VAPHNPELVEAGLSGGAKRQASLARRLHGSPFAVPLGLSTQVVGAGPDLSEALERLVRDRAQVVVVEASAPQAETEEDGASATPAPLRDSSTGRRSEVRREVESTPDPETSQGR